MTPQERLGVLRRVRELSHLDRAALPSLLPYFDEVTVPADTVLARDGCLGHEFFVVAAGVVEVCRHGRATRLGRGDSFGWSVMQERGHHDAEVVAVSSARLLVMGHAQFRAAGALSRASVRSVTAWTASTRNEPHMRPVDGQLKTDVPVSGPPSSTGSALPHRRTCIES